MSNRNSRRNRSFTRTAFLAAGLVAASFGAALLDSRDLAYETAQQQLVTYKLAVANPELRQAYLDKIYRRWNEPAVASIVYDPCKSKLAEAERARGKISVSITYSPNDYVMTKGYEPWEPGELRKGKPFSEGAVANTNGDFLLFAQSNPCVIYISDLGFTMFPSDYPEKRKVLFSSFMEHERQHARDEYYGFDIGNKHTDNETSLLLYANRFLEPMLEVRGHGTQIRFLVEQVRSVQTDAISGYVRAVREIEQLRANLHPLVANTEVAKLADEFLAEQYADALLRQFLEKFGE